MMRQAKDGALSCQRGGRVEVYAELPHRPRSSPVPHPPTALRQVAYGEEREHGGEEVAAERVRVATVDRAFQGEGGVSVDEGPDGVAGDQRGVGVIRRFGVLAAQGAVQCAEGAVFLLGRFGRGEVDAMAAAGVGSADLENHRLDLLSDQGWAEAAEGCRYVLHVASPFVLEKPKDPDDLIRPAVEGATRAVTAALDAGAERVVMTSALATMQFARAPKGHLYAEADRTDPDAPRLNAYTVSKIRAERAALDLAWRRGASDRLAVINPGAVIGPLLTDDPGTSITAIHETGRSLAERRLV